MNTPLRDVRCEDLNNDGDTEDVGEGASSCPHGPPEGDLDRAGRLRTVKPRAIKLRSKKTLLIDAHKTSICHYYSRLIGMSQWGDGTSDTAD